jgi:hypothetical protein
MKIIKYIEDLYFKFLLIDNKKPLTKRQGEKMMKKLRKINEKYKSARLRKLKLGKKNE